MLLNLPMDFQLKATGLDMRIRMVYGTMYLSCKNLLSCPVSKTQGKFQNCYFIKKFLELFFLYKYIFIPINFN